MVNIKASKTHSMGFQVILVFGVTQHMRDEKLMRILIEYLNCGYVVKNSFPPKRNPPPRRGPPPGWNMSTLPCD